MSFITTVLAFLLALGPLIIFHELGHYVVARLCGVKVLRFSVGMGKIVWSRRFGPDQTEWAVSILPLGGYVKMLDSRESPDAVLSPSDLKREFTRQSVWRRIAIVAAGPIANFLLAIAIFAGLYMVGIAEPNARIRSMPESSAAYQAGLRGGDMITKVNGNSVSTWNELRLALIQCVVDKTDAKLEIERPGKGLYDRRLRAESLTGLDVEDDISGKLGLYLGGAAVFGKIDSGGPAGRAGLREGDTVITANGKPVPDPYIFVEAVNASVGQNLELTVRRDGADMLVHVTPEFDSTAKRWRIRTALGIRPEMVTVALGPFAAIGRAAAKTWDTSTLTVKMIGKMITGEVSWKNVTGPITIADYAGKTASYGAAAFLGFVAFISISLGVMNLLPIPVLDGGLLLYYSLEVLTGRPLPERIGEFAQRAGVGLLVALMALAVFNDVVRLL